MAYWIVLIFALTASGQQIGHTPTIYPAPGTSGVPGSLCWQEMRSNGTNTVCLSIPDSIASNYTLKLPSATGTSGQALGLTSAGQLGWLNTADSFPIPDVVRTSSTQLTIGSNCSTSIPCRMRFGALIYEMTASVTADISAGTGTAYISFDTSGGIRVGAAGLTIVCTGCTADAGTSFNVTVGIPLWIWTATSGTWDASGGTDSRAGHFLNLPISGFPPIIVTNTGLTYVVGINHDDRFPLNEVRITDEGAANDCSADIATAWADALAALPVDSSGKQSGIITFPPGCYAVDISSGTAPLLISRAAGYGDVWLVGAGSGNEFAVVGAATEIKITGSAPATDTAIVEFRNELGGGIRNIQFNANGVAKSRIIKIRESRFGKIENVQGRRWTSGPGLEFASETGATSGGCHWNISGLNLGDVKDTDDAAGILFDGGVSGYSACSNQITHSTVIYSKSGSTSYGVKFKYADNNNVTRMNVWASDCTAFPCESNFGTGRLNGTRPAVVFEQSSFSVQFPHENFFHGSPSAQPGYMVTGVSGTGGNVVDISTNDCASPGIENAGCLPNIRNISGRTPSGLYGGRSGAAFPHADADFPTFSLDNTATAITAAGRLNFAKSWRNRAAIGSDETDLYVATSSACDLFAVKGSRSPHSSDNNTLTDIVVSSGTATATVTFTHTCTTASRIRISESTNASLNGEYAITAVTSTTISWATAAGNGTYNNDGLTIEVAPKKWWSFKAGGPFSPVTDGLTSIGTSSVKPNEIWSQEYFSYTSAGFGLQDNTFQSDNQINFYCDVYSSSAVTDRCGYHMRRGRGTLASPAAVGTGDRVGTIAGWGRISSGFDAVTRIDLYADTVSGDNITSSIRFATKNAGGALTDWLTIRGTGGAELGGLAFASLPSSNNGTVIYCTDCTRTATCAGSGTGAIAQRLNTAWSCADSAASGTVTSVSWTGGIVSIANPTTTPAFTIAGTSGGIPYFSSATAWASSAALTANAVMIGGGAGTAPSTISASTTTTHALFATAGAPAFRAIADADIPDTITASNYCALSGCTMTGAITGATRYDSYSSGAVDHVWQTDTANINHYYDQYSAGATDRAGLNFRRSRGTRASPTTVSSGDRLGVVAWWANTSSTPTFAAVTRVDSFATTVSGSNVTSELRFATTNAGSSATDWLKIQGDGGLQWLTGSKPTCDSGHRGTTFYVAGAGGVKDTFEVCGKDASDVFSWRVLY